MKKIITIILILISLNLHAQLPPKVKALPFNTSLFNEMAPVIYKNGLVFSSNRKTEFVTTYTTSNGYHYSLFYVEKKGKSWKKPELFSKSITSPLNESSATFSSDYNLMFFTQSYNAFEKKSKLQNEDSIYNGIYQANQIGSEKKDEWLLTKEFPFNNENYNFLFPNLSPDGNKLFFCSTKPDGFGGYDIYLSENINGRWQEPENLGSVINTTGNEVFPFYNSNGRLYFSSDQHNTQGGQDIFYSEKIDGEWITPINLPRPINSRRDDFGYVISNEMDTGYFVSDRRTAGDDDIYMFTSSFPAFNECKNQFDETFCYEFTETGSLDLDTTSLRYEWDFGDGTKVRSTFGKHCYSKTGLYTVSLNVIDTLTGDIYFSEATYELDVEPVEQAYITSADTVMANEKVILSSELSIIKKFKPKDYFWDFGDGNVDIGATIEYTYNRPGIYYLKLGITSGVDDEETEEIDYSQRTCSKKQIVVIPKSE